MKIRRITLKAIISALLCISMLAGLGCSCISAYADGPAVTEKSLKSMTNMELLKLYVQRMSSYYYEHYQDGTLEYFDSKVYLADNPDVYIDAKDSEDPGFFALEHYLTIGIFEGRSSGTSFDPAVAICLDRDSAVKTLLEDNSTPETLEVYFFECTGYEDIEYFFLLLIDGELYVFPYFDEDDDYQSSGGPNFRIPTYINSRANDLAGKLIPYNLFYDSTSGETKTFDIGNGTSCTFFGGNYQNCKTAGKQYTMMIYMSGSNQEINEGYVRVSSQLMSMLKTENLDNVNVLVCVGGSPGYKNSYMQNDIADIGTGIYYLNVNGLTQDQRQNLNSLDSESLLTRSKDTAGAFDFINENTFIKLADVDSIDMGDPALLAGFINFSSSLFPAADYGLSLSNHGGGTLSGVCFSEDSSDKTIKGTGLEIYELETALASTSIFRLDGEAGTPDGKLGLLFYDACLMAGTEQAYALKDYYRYMVASEETTMSYTDYYSLLTALNSAATDTVDDRQLALSIMDGFKSTSWHGGSFGEEGTIAAFSSADIENTVIALSDVGTAFSNLISSCPDDRSTYSDDYNKVFNALRKAVISCDDFSGNTDKRYGVYTNSKNTLDIGEFLGYLKSNLKSVSVSESNAQLLNTLIGSIDTALSTGFLLKSSIQLDYGKEMISSDAASTGIIPISNLKYADVWTRIRGNSGYYGASLVMPLVMMSGDGSYLDNVSYTSDYEKSALKGYIDMIRSYYNFYSIYLTNSDASQLKKLKGEIKSVQENIRSIIKPDKSYKQNGIEYAVFNVAPTYISASAQAPADSFGSPMQDILETSSIIRLAVIDDKSTGRYRDVYCVSNLNNASLSLDTNAVNVDLAALNQNAEGNYMTGTNGNPKYLNVSDYNFYSSDKQSIISKLVSNPQVDNYTLFEGEVRYTGKDGEYQSRTVFNVFSSGSYIGSVLKSNNDVVWTKSEVNSVACYCYCIDTEDDYTYKHYNTTDSDFIINDSSLQMHYVYLFRQSDGKGSLDMNDVSLALSIDNDGYYYTEPVSIDGSTVTPEAPSQQNQLSENAEEAELPAAVQESSEPEPVSEPVPEPAELSDAA